MKIVHISSSRSRMLISFLTLLLARDVDMPGDVPEPEQSVRAVLVVDCHGVCEHTGSPAAH